MNDDTMALLLLAILRDGKPRTADEIARRSPASSGRWRHRRTMPQRPRGLLHGGVGTDPGGGLHVAVGRGTGTSAH